MLGHTPPRLIQAVFHGMANASEAIEVRRVEPKKLGSSVASMTNEYRRSIMGKLYLRSFRPAALRIALHVPVGTSLAPW